MTDLEFHIEGEQAETATAELQALIVEQFGQAPRRVPTPTSGPGREKSDPWTIAGVILVVPGAILATMDLAERLALKAKAQRLIEFARDQRQRHGTRVWFKRTNRIEPLPLDEAKLSDLLDE